MTVVLRHRVRYHEADAQGFLFNSRYLELADVALTEFFRALGWPYRELVAAGVDPSVVKATVEYKAPARFDDVLDLSVVCNRVGNTSFELTTTVTRESTLIAVMNLVYVNVDATSATSRPLTEAVARRLRASINHVPEEPQP